MRTRTSFHTLAARQKITIWVLLAELFSVLLAGCTKFVTVDELKDQLLNSQVFTDEASANSAIYGLYRSFKDISFTSNILATAAADETTNYGTIQYVIDFATNHIPSNSSNLPWSSLYTMIYRANSAIEGLTASKGKGLSEDKRNSFLAEARFIRAYAYFYLVNYFGEVPLTTSTDISISATPVRKPVDSVYQQITTDLLEAQILFSKVTSQGHDTKTRAGKWATTALLARAYLYMGKWENAATAADAAISSGLYPLLDRPTSILARDNAEAIFQIDRYSGESFAIPLYYVSSGLQLACSASLIAAFEPGDQRMSSWIKTKVVLGVNYQVPNKFTSTANTNINELETPLRIAEMYLIRAEANAMQDKFSDAATDVNLLRQKHGGLTTPLPTPASRDAALDMILLERKRELFSEGSHRWFDLKRTGRLQTVMAAEKPDTWSDWTALFPIPFTELQLNPNMTQNPGYQ